MVITIFTPTYNRAATLPRIFDSLCKQRFDDVEWLIVDDGSTDDTAEVVKSFGCVPFELRYIRIPHGGKHRAYNKALNLAKGEYIFTVDSDDWLPNGSLDEIKMAIDNMDESHPVAGLIGLKANCNGIIYGDRFPREVSIVTLRGLEKCGCKGERSFIIRTKVARENPFPEIYGEDFVTESVVFDRIGAKYRFLALDKVLTICEYLPDGLSSNIYRIMLNNPVGFMIYHSQRIDISDSVLEALQHAIRYHAFRWLSGNRSDWSQYTGRYKWLVNSIRPIGFVAANYYRLKKRWN